MSVIMLKFVIPLERYSEQLTSYNHGPLFHRWLPNGKNDSMILDTGDPYVKLSVWFERFGVSSNNKISFDYSRREVDPKIILTQAVLDGGPLFGLLELQGLSEEEMTCIKENKIGSDAYVKLGKRVVTKLIYPPIHNLIEVLRTNYGQYWLSNLKEWNSQNESLGSYCQNLQLKYSLDNGTTWNKFEPDKSIVRIRVTLNEDFAGYLTEKDRKEVAKVVQKGYEPTLAGQILCRAQQFADQDNLKYAFTEGVLALELAISEFVKKNLQVVPSLLGEISSFWKLPLRAQLVSVAAISERIPTEHIEKAIEAIKIRNELVHEGSVPPSNAIDKLYGLLNATAALISGPKFRLLSANPGNVNQPAKEWEKKNS